MKRFLRFWGFVVVLLPVTTLPLLGQVAVGGPGREADPGSQVGEVNLNSYYRSPLAVSGEYFNWNGFGEYNRDFSVFEGASTVRFTPRGRPGLQPLVRAGYLAFDSLDEEFPEKWDHFHASVGAGLAATSRLSRTFGLSGEVSASLTQTWFEALVDEPVGYNALMAAAGVRISLIPSFNFSIDVIPQARYLLGLGQIDRFDGLAFALGFGATFRTGRDPDAPQTDVRAIRFVSAEVPPAFAALQSWYVNNPIGTVEIENSDSRRIIDVEVLFMQPGFMDSATPAARIDELAPGERISVDLKAGFNGNVFDTEGITPVTGEVIVRYTRDGRSAEQRQSVTYDLHDKTALTWTDDRKMGAFITPSDSAIRNYASFIRRSTSDVVLDGVSQNLQMAMLGYYALEELGIIYQLDPTNPFTEVQGNTAVVDSVTLPRDTLTLLAGDCDDLTALYCTLLETVGIETGFITTPGHIYPVVNTGVPAAQVESVHPDRRRTIIVDGSVWVPVEVTMLGRGTFLDAWNYGIEVWQEMESSPADRGFFRTRDAQGIYRPVGLRQTDLGLQYGDMSRVGQSFTASTARISGEIIAAARREAQERNDRRQWNDLGVLAARWGQYDQAREAFNRAAALDATYVNPRINLGTISFLQEDYRGALRAFEAARLAVESASRVRPSTRATVLVNLARTQYELGQFLEAGESYRLAAAADQSVAGPFSYLDAGGGGGGGGTGIASGSAVEGAGGSAAATGRASDAAAGPTILFAQGDE